MDQEWAAGSGENWRYGAVLLLDLGDGLVDGLGHVVDVLGG